MTIRESIAYLRPIADSAHLKQYAAALETAIRCMEERETMRNELCHQCGNYKQAHNGACDHCRWKE